MFEVRKATFEDLKPIAELFDKYRIFYKKVSDIDSAEIFLTERLKYNDSEIFVSVNHANKIVGFVQLYPIFSSTRMKKLWLLNDLYVNEDFRGQGISTKLIERAKQLCLQTQSCGLILETSKSNIVANSLYLKTDFQLDEDHNYYTWEM